MKSQFGSANSKVQETATQVILNKGLTADNLNLSDLGTAPASAIDTGTKGQIVIDASHIYVCTATDTWVRTAIATW